MSRNYASLGEIYSSQYLPDVSEFTLQDNIDSISLTYGNFRYQVIGNTVTVWGTLAIDPTTAGLTTTLYVPLPISTNISYISQLSGSGAGTEGSAWTINGGTGIEQAVFKSKPSENVNTQISFHFSYEVQ